MKLVLEVECGDGFTFWATDVMTLEYESIDKLNYDILTLCLAAVEKKEFSFEFLGRKFEVSRFGWYENEEKRRGFNFSEPNVFTLEDWFQKNLLRI